MKFERNNRYCFVCGVGAETASFLAVNGILDDCDTDTVTIRNFGTRCFKSIEIMDAILYHPQDNRVHRGTITLHLNKCLLYRQVD